MATANFANRPTREENISAGLRLRRAREARGLTQREAADLLGTFQSSVARWENATHLPTLPRFFEIWIALALDPAELVPELYAEKPGRETS